MLLPELELSDISEDFENNYYEEGAENDES